MGCSNSKQLEQDFLDLLSEMLTQDVNIGMKYLNKQLGNPKIANKLQKIIPENNFIVKDK